MCPKCVLTFQNSFPSYLSYHLKLSNGNRKWLNANVGCCLTVANGFPSMLFYHEIWPNVPLDFHYQSSF